MEQKVTPFSFVNSISQNKKDIFSPETEKQYVPFIINRALSHFLDTVLYANDMNMNHHLDKSLQYQYLLSSIAKRARFAKWARKLEDKEIEMISELYHCNEQRASEISTLLSAKQKEQLQEIYAGITNERQRR